MRSETKSRRSFSEGGKKIFYAMFLVFLFVGCGEEKNFRTETDEVYITNGGVFVRADSIGYGEVRNGDNVLESFMCYLVCENGVAERHHHNKLKNGEAKLDEGMVTVYYQTPWYSSEIQINKVCFLYVEPYVKGGVKGAYQTEACFKPFYDDQCSYSYWIHAK